LHLAGQKDKIHERFAGEKLNTALKFFIFKKLKD